MLRETKNFNKKLYRQNEFWNVDFDLDNKLSYEYIPKVTKGESICLEGEITLAKASKTLCNMKSNKLPESDGFSSEFEKKKWKYIGVVFCVVKYIYYRYTNTSLSIT